MPQIARLFFKSAVVFLILSLAMGLQMSISGNHSVGGAHAHMSLIGWVTGALYGCYYCLEPGKAGLFLSSFQYWLYLAGTVVMTVSLYGMMMGFSLLGPVIAIGALAVFASAILFAVVVFRHVSERPAMGHPAPAE